jgi:hypothetical protein
MFPSCAFANLLLTTKPWEAQMQKRTIAAIATTTALALGVIGSTALAESPPPSAKPSASPQAPNSSASPTGSPGTQRQEPSYTGSVTAPQGAEGQSEASESAALAALAKISEADATKAALAKFPGATVQKATLGDENGFVVWEIELTDASKTAHEVKVDAGNGAILAVEAGGEDGEKSGASGEKD